MSLIVENMIIRSQFAGLKNLIALLILNPREEISQEAANYVYQKVVEAAVQEELATHPSMEPYWRKQIEEVLRDLPGIFLPKKDS